MSSAHDRVAQEDGNILNLVEKFLTAGEMEDGVVQTTTLGTPQGGVLSPLLANISLNFLDWHLEELGLRFVRYADDFVILCRTELQAKENITVRSHNLEESTIAKLNSGNRGIQRYFGTRFSTCMKQFRELDE